MKNKNKGFTIVELLAVILILGLLIVIMWPVIGNIFSSGSSIIKNAKINAINTAASNYVTDNINDYSNCVSASSTSYLTDNCLIDIKKLVEENYLDADDDDGNVIDPESNQIIEGKILACYDVNTLRIETKFYDSSDISTISCDGLGIHSLNLSSSSIAVSYREDLDYESTIITVGDFSNFETKIIKSAGDDALNVTAKIENNKLKIHYTKASGDFPYSDYRTVTVQVIGTYKDKDNHSEKIIKNFSLYVYDEVDISVAGNLYLTIKPSMNNPNEEIVMSCYQRNSSGCQVVLPDIELTNEYSDYVNYGYNDNINVTTTQYEPGSNFKLTSSNNGKVIYANVGKPYVLTLSKGTYTNKINNKNTVSKKCTAITESCSIAGFPDFTPKSGYYKLGYSETKDDNNINHNITSITINDNKTIYANSGKDVTLTLKPGNNNTTFTQQAKTCTMASSDGCYILLDRFTAPSGYGALGYGTSASASSITNEMNSLINLTDNKTLFALVKAGTYTVMFDANGGEGTMGDQVFQYDKSQKLSKNTFTYENNVFIGWATSRTGTKRYSDEETVTNLTNPGDSTTLYAVWIDFGLGAVQDQLNFQMYWEIGKVNRSDVLAGLFKNSSDDSYTLSIITNGLDAEMLDFTLSNSTGGGWMYAPWYNDYRDQITGVHITNGVTNIGDNAFKDLVNLTSVNIPSKASYIGKEAFSNCSIESLVIPRSVTHINEKAFNDNKYLYTLNFENNSNLKYVGDYAFFNNKISSLNLPQSLEETGKYSFAQGYNQNKTDLTRLKTLNIPENSNLKNVGDYSFRGNKLTSLNIPSSVVTIGYSGFAQDYYIDSTTHEYIHKPTLTQLTFSSNSNLKTIGGYAFVDTIITSLTIPSSVLEIGKSAFSTFYNMASINNLAFENNSKLKTIGDFAFFNLTVSTLDLPKSVEKIGSEAFGSNVEITSFTVGPNVKEIGDRFILGLYLKEFQVSNENTFFAVKDGVLYNKDFTKLVKAPDLYGETYSELIIPSSVREIQNYAFDCRTWLGINYRVYSVTLPPLLEKINSTESDDWSNVNYLTIDGSNSFYTTVDGVLFSKDKKTLHTIPHKYGATLVNETYSVPNGTQKIDSYAGFENQGIRTLLIPESVTEIGAYAFSSHCSDSEGYYGGGYCNIYLRSTNSNSLVLKNDAFSSWYYEGELESYNSIKKIYVKNNTMMELVKNNMLSSVHSKDLRNIEIIVGE